MEGGGAAAGAGSGGGSGGAPHSVSCPAEATGDALKAEQAAQREALLARLHCEHSSPRFLFGGHFFNSWSAPRGLFEDPCRSDVCDVVGAHPAVLEQDLLYILHREERVGEVHRAARLQAHEWGCLVSLAYHMPSMTSDEEPDYKHSESSRCLMQSIAQGKSDCSEWLWFETSMKAVAAEVRCLGKPVVLRLFHEMNGGWFWWGSKAEGGAKAYIGLFRCAVEIIRKETPLALFAWAPNHPFDAAAPYYPGNDVVDVIGLDMYDMGAKDGPPFLGEGSFASSLAALRGFAQERGKVAAITETGNRIDGATTSGWWKQVHDAIVAGGEGASGIAWVLAYGNAPWLRGKDGRLNDARAIVPHAESPPEQRSDFRAFASLPAVRLLGGQ